jgi:hypothetical protein
MLSPVAAEHHIRQQLKVQAQTMRRRGIDERVIAHELDCLETSIRATLSRAVSGVIR